MIHPKIHISFPRKERQSYDIIFNYRINEIAKAIKAEYHDKKLFVITDSCVGPLYDRWFREKATVIRIPAGEKYKNRAMKEHLENRLLKAGIDRNSLLIALGGGVVGDLGGFVASTILRGIPYIQIPTSLLAQVDSSIGGKVAVNHPRGKNLIGGFHHPVNVYIDLRTLRTLPHIEFRNGMAEVIKYAAILDKTLFHYLEVNSRPILLQHFPSLLRIIHRCCELKRKVIQIDEREEDSRRILNFGHTIGHALEQSTAYHIPHGTAVAIGMVAEARISMLMGLLKESDFERLILLLRKYELPTMLPQNCNFHRLIRMTQRDKKVKNDLVYYTVLRAIGDAKVGIPLSARHVIPFLHQ
jgi:3-dehydroquinate synthase